MRVTIKALGKHSSAVAELRPGRVSPSKGSDRRRVSVAGESGRGRACELIGTSYPVAAWVGVDPSAINTSNPSGVFSDPGAVPGRSVMPYCHTSGLDPFSTTLERFRS